VEAVYRSALMRSSHGILQLSAKGPTVSGGGSKKDGNRVSLLRFALTWACELQVKERQEMQGNKERAASARQTYKDAQRKRRLDLQAAKERKEEKRKANDRLHGQVVSAATARKMMKSKKLRKQLVVT
jgi:hypothetical protein